MACLVEAAAAAASGGDDEVINCGILVSMAKVRYRVYREQVLGSWVSRSRGDSSTSLFLRIASQSSIILSPQLHVPTSMSSAFKAGSVNGDI